MSWALRALGFPDTATARSAAALERAEAIGDPPRVAQRLVDGGFTPRYDYGLQTLSELPYDKWREYDHEDTIRYYACTGL